MVFIDLRHSEPQNPTPTSRYSCVFANMVEIHVTKQAVAKRQIDAAIRILFAGEDPLAVHTVVAAAHGVLVGLEKKHRQQSTVADAYSDALNQLEKVFPDETLRQIFNGNDFKTWYQEIRRRPANFLKHADRDADKALNIAALETDHTLLEACTLYADLGFEPTIEMHAFARWHLAVYPHLEGDRLETASGFLHSLARNAQLECGKFLLERFYGQVNH